MLNEKEVRAFMDSKHWMKKLMRFATDPEFFESKHHDDLTEPTIHDAPDPPPDEDPLPDVADSPSAITHTHRHYHHHDHGDPSSTRSREGAHDTSQTSISSQKESDHGDRKQFIVDNIINATAQILLHILRSNQTLNVPASASVPMRPVTLGSAGRPLPGGLIPAPPAPPTNPSAPNVVLKMLANSFGIEDPLEKLKGYASLWKKLSKDPKFVIPQPQYDPLKTLDDKLDNFNSDFLGGINNADSHSNTHGSSKCSVMLQTWMSTCNPRNTGDGYTSLLELAPLQGSPNKVLVEDPATTAPRLLSRPLPAPLGPAIPMQPGTPLQPVVPSVPIDKIMKATAPDSMLVKFILSIVTMIINLVCSIGEKVNVKVALNNDVPMNLGGSLFPATLDPTVQAGIRIENMKPFKMEDNYNPWGVYGPESDSAEQQASATKCVALMDRWLHQCALNDAGG